MTRDWDVRAGELAAEAYGRGEPTTWFDRLYAEGAAGAIGMPWDRDQPHPALARWAEQSGLDGAGSTAVVVGAGLGADAEFLVTRGFRTVAFDIAPTAVAQARSRHPGTEVDYRVADLLDLPDDLVSAGDLVVEIFTLQALPDPPRTAAAAGVRRLVAAGGTLVAVQFQRESLPEAEREADGPPWPLDRSFMEGLAADGLDLVALEAEDGRWVGEYRRVRPG